MIKNYEIISDKFSIKNDFSIKKYKSYIVSFVTIMAEATQILKKLDEKFAEFMCNPYVDGEISQLERLLKDAKIYFNLHQDELTDELVSEFKEWFFDQEDELVSEFKEWVFDQEDD